VALVFRLCMVSLAYLLACIAASLVLTIGAVTPQWDNLGAGPLPSAAAWLVVGVGAAAIAGVAMVPALLVIALAEGFAWRSVVLYGALGGVLALAITYGIDFGRYLGAPDAFPRQREVLAASGIAGGLVYWLFAGRKAGGWKL
jgi:hypothetical protein